MLNSHITSWVWETFVQLFYKVFCCTSQLSLHLIKNYYIVNHVHLFPLPWEGYKPHCSHVANTCNLEDKVVLLAILTKHPLSLNYQGYVICQGLKDIELVCFKIIHWIYIRLI